MKEKLKKVFNRKRFVAVVLMALMAMVMSVGAFAEDEIPSATAGIQSAVTTALHTTQSDVMTTIAGVLPYALAIVGAVLVVNMGIKVFKKVSGK